MKKVEVVLEYQLPIRIEPQPEGGFLAICPNWPDCFAQGKTIEEAVLEITAVAQSLIEVYKEENLAIPLKRGRQKKVANLLTVPVIIGA